jgi:nucleoid DNA-binding protein
MAKTVSQADLLKRTLALMEPENFTTQTVGRDFMESMAQAVENALGKGEAVNIGGIVKLTPKYRAGGKREVLKEFGNPEAGKVKKHFPAKIAVKATALKRAKDSLPGVNTAAAKALKK